MRPSGVALYGVSAFGAGLLDGDVVTAVGGTTTTSAGMVIAAVAGAVRSGARAISAVIWRDQQQIRVPFYALFEPVRWVSGLLNAVPMLLIQRQTMARNRVPAWHQAAGKLQESAGSWQQVARGLQGGCGILPERARGL